MSNLGQVKVIGTNGQISLGKEFAGKHVVVSQVAQGTWVIKTGAFLPDSEQWLYQNNQLAQLETGLAWAEKNKPNDNFDKFIASLPHD